MKLEPVNGIEKARLPSEADFDPFGGDLDAQSAWRNFGGLTLEEAYVRFSEVPVSYQEDFMFMGGRAFHYYFPVLDEFLRTSRAKDEWDDCQTEILASCITAQFDWRGANISSELRERISQLCLFVRANLDQYASSSERKSKIDQAWAKLEERLR